MNKYIAIGCAAWSLLTGTSFFIAFESATAERSRLAMKIAQSSLGQILVFRKWNAAHGAVYAPVTEHFRPNPYLKNPLRDIYATGKKLTMINPSFMTREASEIASLRSGIHFRLTSLRVMRPENAPTRMEEEALKEFEKGKGHVGFFLGEGEQGAYFYMEPVRTEKECLTCHSFQGYKVNDIQGGISVILPFVPKSPLTMLATVHVAVLALGLTLIFALGRRLAQAYEKIRAQAVTDALTGIPNRFSFEKTIRIEINRCARDNSQLTVIMMDIDHFKPINDAHGHAFGDECLKFAAMSIAGSLRRAGDFCARIGGEEFIILLPDTGINGAVTVAERIRERMKMPVQIKHATAQVSIRMSYGIAAVKDFTVQGIDTVLKEADRALYTAKSEGRDRIVVFGEKT